MPRQGTFQHSQAVSSKWCLAPDPHAAMHHEERFCPGIRTVCLPRNLPEPGASFAAEPVTPTAASPRAIPARLLKLPRRLVPHPSGARPKQVPASCPAENRSSKPGPWPYGEATGHRCRLTPADPLDSVPIADSLRLTGNRYVLIAQSFRKAEGNDRYENAGERAGLFSHLMGAGRFLAAAGNRGVCDARTHRACLLAAHSLTVRKRP